MSTSPINWWYRVPQNWIEWINERISVGVVTSSPSWLAMVVQREGEKASDPFFDAWLSCGKWVDAMKKLDKVGVAKQPEPERLRRGKAFHHEVQNRWLREYDGKARSELAVRKPNGRAGRIDLCLDPNTNTVGVVEIKASDWDRMTEAAVRRNVKRHAAQVFQYVDSHMSGVRKGVCPGVVLQSGP